MGAIAEPVTWGDLPDSLLTKCLGIHGVCQIWSVQSHQLWFLSDLLEFDPVFRGPCWGLLAGCSHGVCCSFPEVLSLKWGKLFWTDSTRNSWIYWVLAFMGVIQQAQFGNECGISRHFQSSDLLQDAFKDDLPQHLAEPSPSGHQGLHSQALASLICGGIFWISCAKLCFHMFDAHCWCWGLPCITNGFDSFYAWWGDVFLTKMLCTAYSVPGKLCKNILVEVLIFLSCMHAKVQADYWILMAPQGFVRSAPWGGVALGGKMNCECHVSTMRGLMLCLLLATPAHSLCRAQGLRKMCRCWGRAAGWATQGQPPLPSLSVTVTSLCQVWLVCCGACRMPVSHLSPLLPHLTLLPTSSHGDPRVRLKISASI